MPRELNKLFNFGNFPIEVFSGSGNGERINVSINDLKENAPVDVPLNAGSGFSTSFFGTFTSSVTPCKLLSKYGTLGLVKMWEYSLILSSDEPATEVTLLLGAGEGTGVGGGTYTGGLMMLMMFV